MNNHVIEDCRKPYRCNVDGCKANHSRLLHPESTSTVASSNVVVNNDVSSNACHVLMPIVPVTVNDSFHTYALLDTGSSRSFCSKRMYQSLGISGDDTELQLKTLNAAQDRCMTQVKLTIQPDINSSKFQLNNVLVAENIPVTHSTTDLSKYEHLRDLACPGQEQVDLLIGQDHSDLLIVQEYHRGKAGEPYAVKTPLG